MIRKILGLPALFLLTFAYSYSPSIYVLCEGVWGEGNGSLWSIGDGEMNEEFNMIGDVSQSLYSYRDRLFVVNNASGNIQVYRYSDGQLYLDQEIDTNGSGPREMLVLNDRIYFTNWYSLDMKVLDLDTYQELGSVLFNQMPEDIVTDGQSIWVSLMLEQDYTDGSTVAQIDPASLEIIAHHDVGLGPNEMVVHEGKVFISRTWYDQDWNAYYGTSMIDGDTVISTDYGQGSVCGGGVMVYQGDVYRSFNGGIAPIDSNLELIDEQRIGSYDSYSVYSVEAIDDMIYFGLSDFNSSNHVAVVDSYGNELEFFDVGILPGDFAKDQRCSVSGDLDIDYNADVVDVLQLVSYVTGNDHSVECDPDINGNGIVDILDIVTLVNLILGR